MALILLVSTLQFSIYKMDCLMSGNTQVSLVDFEDCNENKNNGCSLSQKCCDFKDITFNFDYDSNIHFESIKLINSVFLLNEIFIDLSKPVFAKTDFVFYTNLSPPSGYELLKVVQVFRL